MHCVDLMLRPRPKPSDWDLEKKNFVCHRCEVIYKGESSELYYFTQLDFVYHLHEHLHKGDIYYRAFWIENDGTVHIAGADPKMTAISIYGIILDGKGDFTVAGEIDDLIASSKKFFRSMQRQNRKFEEIFTTTKRV